MITNQTAIDLGVAAGDQNMKSAGREVWNEEDRAAAEAVYQKLRPTEPVQKMDEQEEDDANTGAN